MTMKQELMQCFSLETERLILQVPEFDDADMIQAAKEARSDDLRRWMSWSTPEAMSMAGTVAFLAHALDMANNRNLPIMAISKATGDFVLMTGLDAEDDNFKTVSTGYWMAKRFEGQGYGFEAMTAVLRLTFEQAGTQKANMAYYEGNQRSRNLMKRLGFSFESLEPKGHICHLDGRAMDVYNYTRTVAYE